MHWACWVIAACFVLALGLYFKIARPVLKRRRRVREIRRRLERMEGERIIHELLLRREARREKL